MAIRGWGNKAVREKCSGVQLVRLMSETLSTNDLESKSSNVRISKMRAGLHLETTTA